MDERNRKPKPKPDFLVSEEWFMANSFELSHLEDSRIPKPHAEEDTHPKCVIRERRYATASHVPPAHGEGERGTSSLPDAGGMFLTSPRAEHTRSDFAPGNAAESRLPEESGPAETHPARYASPDRSTPSSRRSSAGGSHVRDRLREFAAGRVAVTPRHLRVLVVADGADDAHPIQTELAQATHVEFQVTLTRRLEADLSARADKEFDVILLDLPVPDGHGLETVRVARTIAGATPIVVLSGSEPESDGLLVLQAGAEDYLVRGRTSPALLEHTIRHAVARAHTSDRGPSPGLPRP